MQKSVIPKQQQYRLVLVLIDTWWYWVLLKVEGGSDWYLVVLGQQKALLVNTLWYWVSIGRY